MWGPVGSPRSVPATLRMCLTLGRNPVLSAGVCSGAGVWVDRLVVLEVLVESPGQGLTAGFPAVACVSQAGVYGTRG